MLNVNPYPNRLLNASAALKSSEESRAAKVPSQRDQNIFQRVEVGCERQCAVAAELRLTPSRVSQIVARVRRWLASGAQGDPQTLATLESRRLERTLAIARQQAIYQRLMREADRQERNPRQSAVRTTVQAGKEDIVVTTVREQPLNVQLLKAAQRAAMEIERLAEREPLPPPEADTPSDEKLRNACFHVLCVLREHSEQEGYVPRADHFRLIHNTLAALLDPPRDSQESSRQPGSAQHERGSLAAESAVATVSSAAASASPAATSAHAVASLADQKSPHHENQKTAKLSPPPAPAAASSAPLCDPDDPQPARKDNRIRVVLPWSHSDGYAW